MTPRRLNGMDHGVEIVWVDWANFRPPNSGWSHSPEYVPTTNTVADTECRILTYLAGHPEASGRDVERNIQGRTQTIGRVLRGMVQDGRVAAVPGPRRAILHTLNPVLPSAPRLIPGSGPATG